MNMVHLWMKYKWMKMVIGDVPHPEFVNAHGIYCDIQ